MIVVGEMTGVQTGLGPIIMEARQLSRTEIVISGMIVIGVAGFISDRLVMLIGRPSAALEPAHYALTATGLPILELKGVGKQLRQNGRARSRRLPGANVHDPRRRVHLPDRRVRLRQVHAVARWSPGFEAGPRAATC